MAATDEEPFQIDGDVEYVTHRREKSIFDTRDLTRNIILEAKRQYRRGSISDEVLQTDARTAVEMFITEVEHLAIRVGSKDLLEEVTIHEVAVHPPDSLLEYFESDEHRVLGKRPEPKKAATIHGLWGFLTAPSVFTEEFTAHVNVRHKGPMPITETASTRMPVEASIDAFRHVNTFLERVGLDLEPKLEDYTGDEGPGL